MLKNTYLMKMEDIHMRKFVSILMALTLTSSLSTITMADNSLSTLNEKNIIHQLNNNIEDASQDFTIQATEISYDEYINRLAAEKNISREEAIEFDNQQNIEILKDAKSRNINQKQAGIVYKDLSFTKRYNKNTSFSYDTNLTVKLYGEYIYYQVEDVLGMSTRISSGFGSAEFIEEAAWAEPVNGSFPTTDLHIYSRGYFQVTNDASMSGGGSIAGFEISGSVGSTTYQTSDSISLNTTWHPYS